MASEDVVDDLVDQLHEMILVMYMLYHNDMHYPKLTGGTCSDAGIAATHTTVRWV